EPGSTTYVIPRAQQLRGPLDTRALEWSFQELMRRHESLRTIFVERDGQPVQIICPANAAHLPLVDSCLLARPQRGEEARRLIEQEACQPCDLTGGPLMPTQLIRMENEEHILLLTLHHIVYDAWSDEILRRELLTLYEAVLAGQPSPLPPLPIQYADFAIWQRQWLQGSILEAHLEYWKRQLAGMTALKLPADHPRPARRNQRGASCSFRLSPGLSQDLLLL